MPAGLLVRQGASSGPSSAVRVRPAASGCDPDSATRLLQPGSAGSAPAVPARLGPGSADSASADSQPVLLALQAALFCGGLLGLGGLDLRLR